MLTCEEAEIKKLVRKALRRLPRSAKPLVVDRTQWPLRALTNLEHNEWKKLPRDLSNRWDRGGRLEAADERKPTHVVELRLYLTADLADFVTVAVVIDVAEAHHRRQRSTENLRRLARARKEARGA